MTVTQFPRPPAIPVEDQKEAWRLSLVIAALSNLMSHDTDPVLRAACRARYLDLTDGKPMP